LGLASYYRKFIKNFGIISKPLTDLLKKNSFKWNINAQKTFEQLKRALYQTLILALSNFHKMFILKTNACTTGLGDVLSQEGWPIACISKALGVKHIGLSIYKKEITIILMVTERWRHYLERDQFLIKTNHANLKYLLK